VHYRPIFLLAACCLASCKAPNISYPIPEQHLSQPLTLKPVDLLLEMNDEDLSSHVVADIREELNGGEWRWSGKRPELSIFVAQVEGLRFSADFSIWDTGLAQTGPLTLTFLVNGRAVGTVRYQNGGGYHYESPIPAGILLPFHDNSIGISVDKLYVGADGELFGIILTRMGFR
jgi:hypothetical protein